MDALLKIRPYTAADAEATLAVFLDAIAVTAARHYSPEQLRVWARVDDRDPAGWNAQMAARNSVVAVLGGEVVGFSDVSRAGRIDMLFVAPDHSRAGVGGMLLAHVERAARAQGIHELVADVSITARPLFERQGFAIVAEQHPQRAGVALTNFRMRKALVGPPGGGEKPPPERPS